MAASPTVLSEAELHGLVDGQIEADRRADLLRRAGRSPGDRERVEAWQEQADMIRSAFGGIERESVPAVLNLRSPARLQCVPDPLVPGVAPRRSARGAARTRTLVGAVAAFVVAASMVAVFWPWSFLTKANAPTSVLAGWAANDGSGAQLIPLVSHMPEPPATAVAMPVTTIPDLTFAGFTFVSAETRLRAPVSLVLHYSDARAQHVTIAVMRADENGAAAEPNDTARWHNGHADYAISGDVGADRLRAIKSALRDEMQDE